MKIKEIRIKDTLIPESSERIDVLWIGQIITTRNGSHDVVLLFDGGNQYY